MRKLKTCRLTLAFRVVEVAIAAAVAVLSSVLRFAGTVAALGLTDTAQCAAQVALARHALGPVHVAIGTPAVCTHDEIRIPCVMFSCKSCMSSYRMVRSCFDM